MCKRNSESMKGRNILKFSKSIKKSKLMISAIIYFIVVIIICFALYISCTAEQRHYKVRAGVNAELINVLNKADAKLKSKRLKARLKAIKKETKKEKIKEKQQRYEDQLINRFGYIPTNEEINLIKRICMAEGGNTEPLEGIVAEFFGVANRVKHRRDDNPRYQFGNTITEVAYQSGQFDTVSNGTIWRYEINDKTEQAWDIFLSSNYPSDFIYIKYYDQVYSWTAGRYNSYFDSLFHIGNHFFGKLKQ